MKKFTMTLRMSALLFGFILLAKTSNASAQTDIAAGNVSGLWAKANSPYHINGEITVPNGETLTIEPGVEVIFQGHYKFNIQGRILAIGTEQDSIIFTADDHSAGWHGLRFDNTPSSNDSSIIEYCRLEYGKANTGSGFVNRCGGAIYANCDKLRISHCLFQLNMCYNTDINQTGGGAIVIVGGNPIISHCEFNANTSSFFGGALLIWFGSSKGQIVDNYIHHSTGHGTITIGGGASTILYDNLIVNNHSTGHGVIHISDPPGMSVLVNNTIANNTCAGAGGAVFVNHGLTPLFINNIIHGNTPAQVRLEAPSGLDFVNCLIEGGEEGFSGASFTGIYQNNIDYDPMFVDVANDDYHLSDTSPCISAGGDSIKVGDKWYYAPDCDNEGNPRPNPPSTSPDIGAFESKLGGPYIQYLSNVLDDSDGNNNGRADAGETAKLIVTLKNTSLDATGVSATLTNDDPDVQIIHATANFGDLARDQSSSNQNAPFTFSVSPSSVTHLSTFYLNITVVEGGYAYIVSFKILIGTPAILLVDDDEGDTYEVHYTKTLEMKQIYSEAWDVSLNGSPTIDVLERYESVIWFTGDDRDSTLTAEEQSVIAAFLDGGGKLLITGQDIGFDLVENGSASDSVFYTNYLHAQYIADSSSTSVTRGVSGDPITGSPSRMLVYFTGSYGGAGNQTSTDVISPIAPAETILEYGPPFETGAALKHENRATGSRLVYLAFGFEGIAGPAEESAARLMENILKWLKERQTPVEENLMESVVPKAYVLSQNYPNPFNPTTTIQYSVPSTQYIDLKIHDLLGKEVASLVSETKQPGVYSVTWDAHGFSSGVYFCRLKAGSFVDTKRMILLR
jgi:hypothetical protein